MDYKTIKFITDSHIAQIVLNRPASLNALNRDMWHDMLDAVKRTAADDSVRAVVISGAEGNFAAGGDIADMVDLTPLEAARFVFHPVFNAIEDLPVPVIAAVSGYALGGGMELALACDFRIFSETASAGFPEINLGIFPGAGGTQRLPLLIGLSRAKELIFTGQRIDARKALEWGLCDRLVAGDPLPAALEMAANFAKKSPVALKAAKRVMNFGAIRGMRASIPFEEEAWAGIFSSEDQKEGMRAFLEKRKPAFKGK
ncbi:MAG TPA: enoyl-CoA hydratase/isomerase family protein [Spirochaetota bacterium]|nr:enoyl-CoA hydratase/isomerase family protein [Spirochaetota bacterium]